MEDRAVLEHRDVRDLPKGKCFAASYGVWVLEESLETLFLCSESSQHEFDISDLELKASDVVHSIEFIRANEIIFIYATRNLTPTAFFVSVANAKGIVPKALAVALDTITFHTKIVDAFVPVDGAFCVVSQEGMSLHRMDLRDAASLYHSVVSCCHDRQFVMIFSPEGKTLEIYQFNEKGPTMTLVQEVTGWRYPVPVQMIALSHSLALLSYDNSADVIIHKIPLDGTGGTKLQTYQRKVGVDVPAFHAFDDALIVSSRQHERAALIDVWDANHPEIGSLFEWPANMQGVSMSKYAVYEGKLLEIIPNYAAIENYTVEMIGALFRRTGGIASACALLSRELRSVKSVKQMKQIVQSIGPSVMNPDSQLRVAHAIQFSGITDPHLILLGLIEFHEMLGNKAILETRKIVVRAMIHPLCRNALSNLLATQFKMDLPMLRCVFQECGESLFIDISHVEDILDYAEVCIEFGQTEKAKTLLLRATLDENPDKPRIESLKEKLQQILKEK